LLFQEGDTALGLGHLGLHGGGQIGVDHVLAEIEAGLALGALPHDADLDFPRNLGLGRHAEDPGRRRDLSTEPLFAASSGEDHLGATVLHRLEALQVGEVGPEVGGLPGHQHGVFDEQLQAIGVDGWGQGGPLRSFVSVGSGAMGVFVGHFLAVAGQGAGEGQPQG